MYAVAGASGRIGAIVAETLLDWGLPLRVVVTSADRGARWMARGADVAVADVTDASTLAGALRGIRSVYLPSASGRCFLHAPAMAENFATALQTAGVERAVMLSAISAQSGRGTGILQANHVVERRLTASRTPITWLRAGYFFENFAPAVETMRRTGVLPSLFDDLHRPVPMVSLADVGATAAKLMTETWFGRRLVELAGPNHTTPHGAAQAFGLALGRTVRAEILPHAQRLARLEQWGHEPQAARAIAYMYEGFNSGTVRFAGALPRRGKTSMRSAAEKLVARR